ncbi:MAG: hypothetical protein LBB94_06595 [Clostridiales bacterium]|jgi:hypothetical protein|nr:hypothetical protein [Clostridiales bacterium]
MDCEFCGAQNSDDAEFCKQCGNNINNTKKAPRRKLFIIAGSIIILLCIAAAAFSAFYKRAWAQLFVSDGAYASKYVQSYAIGLTDSLLTDDAISSALLSAVNPGALSLSYFSDNQEHNFYIGARTDAGFLKDIMKAAGVENEFSYNIANIICNSVLSFDVRTSAISKGFLSLLSGKWTIAGQDLLSLNAAMDEKAIYLSSPELYSKDLAIDLSDMNIVESAYEQLEGSRQAKENAAQYTGGLRDMTRDLLKTAVKDMSFTLDKNALMEINRHEIRAHMITVTEAELRKGQAAAINAIIGSDEYIELLVELLNNYSEDIYDADGVKAKLMDLKAEAEREIGDSGLLAGLYIDSGNHVSGYLLKSGDVLQINAGAELTAGYEIQLTGGGSSGQTEVSLFGDLAGGAGGLSGTVNISGRYAQSGGGRDFNIALGTFSDLFLKKYNGVMTPNLNVDLTLDPVWEELEKIIDTPYDITEFFYLLNDSRLKISIEAEGKKASSSVALGAGDKFELTVNYSGESDTAQITPPGYNDLLYIDPENPMNNMDMGEVISNVMVLLGKLKDAGYDAQSLLNRLLFYGAR